MKEIKSVLIITGMALVLFHNVKGQEVDWLPFDSLGIAMREEARPVMIFVHTDWCKFCAIQDRKTFTSEAVVQMLNESFYALKLNGEHKEVLKFLNKTYSFKPTGVGTGTHELAEMLGSIEGKLSFPTTVFLDDRFQLMYRQNDFIDSETMMKYLRELSHKDR